MHNLESKRNKKFESESVTGSWIAKIRTSPILLIILQLDTICKQNVQIKAFGETKGQLKELGEYKFDLRGSNGDGLRIYLSGFSVPLVCGSVNGQKVIFVISNYPFLKNLKLVDEGLHKENIDLLIGADIYWDIVDRSVKRVMV